MPIALPMILIFPDSSLSLEFRLGRLVVQVQLTPMSWQVTTQFSVSMVPILAKSNVFKLIDLGRVEAWEWL